MAGTIGLFSEASLNGSRDVHAYYRELGEQIVLGDQLGFDFFSTTQSYGRDLPETTFSISPDPLALFASQIPLTQRIKILTGILIAPFHNPAMAISNFAAVDVLSQGRVMIGFGRGHPWLYDRVGLDQEESKARASEFCSMLRTMLDAPAARHNLEGEHFQVRDFELVPQFVQEQVDAYFAVSVSESSAVEAATHRLGMLMPSYLGIPLEMVNALVERYRSEYRKLWGEEGSVLLGIHSYGDADAEKAAEVGARGLAGQLHVFAQTMRLHESKVGSQYPSYNNMAPMFEALSEPAACRAAVEKEWPNYLAVWGNAEVAVPRFAELIESVGPDGLILNIDSGGLPNHEVVSGMEYTGREILPELRKLLD
ncbi:LLM class flavin-dependent oxidoreductase [Myxococcota bacterium]|nr:LLM class flavin-dependent oxidoreductase [Myxococcota bacterium]